MEIKYLCIAVMASLLTGCISTKVNNAYTTTKSLSENVEKFSKLSNKTVELNRILSLNERQRNLSDNLLPGNETNNLERDKNSSSNFYTAYRTMYHNKTSNDAYILQNKYIVEYFKQLPLILEDKSVDIGGLVKNIDTLNKIIEDKVTDEETPVPGLNEVQTSLITRGLSSAFKARQYAIFKKINQVYSPIILKALDNQQKLFRINGLLVSNEKLNNEYYLNFIKLQNAYIKQYRDEAIKLGKNPNGSIPVYSFDEIKKIDIQVNNPFTLISSKNLNINSKFKPKVESEAYKSKCIKSNEQQKKDMKTFLANNDKNWIKIGDPLFGTVSNEKVLFDVEYSFQQSGSDLICNFINIVGLMSENNTYNIELSKFEKNMQNYETLLNFFSNKYLPVKED
jgi:hypothetical protein